MVSLEDESTSLVQNDDDCNNDKTTLKDYSNHYFWKRPRCPFTNIDMKVKDKKGKLMALGFLNNDRKK